MDVVYHKGIESFVVKNDTRDFFVRKETYGPAQPMLSAWEITNNGFRQLELSEIQSLGIADVLGDNNKSAETQVVTKPKRKYSRRAKTNDPDLQ